MSLNIQAKQILVRSSTFVLACALLCGTGLASQAGKNASKSAPSAAAAAATAKPSAAEIASAKAKGMVWVNTKSRVYHTHGRYYGKTSHGKFMTLADAKKAGYRAAKR